MNVFFLQNKGLAEDPVDPHEIDLDYIGSGTYMGDDADEADVENTEADADGDQIDDDDDDPVVGSS